MDDLWQPIRFDREMIVKYDRPGPRYTSYPTAPQFTDDFGPPQYREVLSRSGELGCRPLSLYVHVPFCDVRCFFCGCNAHGSIKRSEQLNDVGFNSFFKTGWKRFYLKWYDDSHPSADAGGSPGLGEPPASAGGCSRRELAAPTSRWPGPRRRWPRTWLAG